MLSAMDADDMMFQRRQLRDMKEAEIAEKEYKLERYERDLAEQQESVYA